MPDPPELHWTPERVQAFWNYNARSPDHYFTFNKGRGVLRRLRGHLARRREVLDYGCGSGHLLSLLLETGHRAGGVDFSRDSVKAVAERFADRPGFLGAWEPEVLAAEGRRFDAVLVVEVVEHLYDDVLDATLARVRGLLAPGGIAVFTTPNEERLEDAMLFCPGCQHVFHRHQHVRSWSEATLRATLEGRGFEVVDSFTTDFGSAFLRRNRKKWKAVRKTVRYALRPGKKRPHLAMVARARTGDAGA